MTPNKKVDLKKKIYIPTTVESSYNSSMPVELLKLFGQDKINDFDDKMTIKGFMRKGVLI